MKYKNLLLLSAFWAFLMPTLEGKNLLACPYDPRTQKTEFEQQGVNVFGKLTAAQIRQRVVRSRMYDTMHPTIREWVDGYRKNYFHDSAESVVLYNDNQNGIQIRMHHQVTNAQDAQIVFARTRFFEDDVAWNYQKEPAINPQTGRPWIELSASELRTVNRGNKVMDEPDQEFLQDVLSILNENFHYFYGMQLVDLGRNPETNPEELIGKLIPGKMLVFGTHVDMFESEGKTAQQVSLYRSLGHPIYALGPLLDTERNYRGNCSHCKGRGGLGIYLRSGLLISSHYFNQVDVSEVNPSLLARAIQTYQSSSSFSEMMDGLKRVCEERGVNLRSQAANKTPLTRALYLVYHKTDKYVEEMVNHPYIVNYLETHALEEGVNHVYDAVPIKGLYEGRSSSRSSSRTSSNSSSRTRTTTSRNTRNTRNTRRNQSSSRERN